MTHTAPTPHDAEEQLRPYLGALYDAEEARRNADPGPTTIWAHAAARHADAALAVVAVTLRMLGVRG